MLDKTGFNQPPVRRSALSHRLALSTPDGEAKLIERPFIGKLIIRGDHHVIAPILKDKLGINLPAEASQSIASGNVNALWLGPDEWMLLSSVGKEKQLAEEIGSTLHEVHYQLVDVTDYYTIIRIAGSHGITMLSKLTTLDLHDRSFPEGCVKGSVFVRVPAILRRLPFDVKNGICFDLFIRWSHADYLWCVLARSGEEFGIPTQIPYGKVELAMPG